MVRYMMLTRYVTHAIGHTLSSLVATRIATKSWAANSNNPQLQLPSLENRRKYHKLLITYKFLHVLTYCPPGPFNFPPKNLIEEYLILNVCYNHLLRLWLSITLFLLVLLKKFM